jgi:sugar phosphate isomerase/epimerase
MNDIKLGVTLYAFGGLFNTGEKNLEELLALSHSMGFEGVELVAAQMAEEYPFCTDEWLGKFKDSLKRNKLELSSWSAYTDLMIRPDRYQTDDEILMFTRNDLIYGKKAGALIMRSQPGISTSVFRKAREIAKILELPITFELHSPMSINTPHVKELMEVIAEPESKGLLGVTPDFSIFQFQPPAPARKNYIRDGFDPKRFETVLELLKQKAPHEEIERSFDYSENEKNMLRRILHSYGSISEIEDLDYLIPYSPYIHGKFHYINDDFVEDSIPYDKIIPRIKKLGYKGYIACEYEGHGMDLAINAVDQLNRFRKMVSGLLDR